MVETKIFAGLFIRELGASVHEVIKGPRALVGVWDGGSLAGEAGSDIWMEVLVFRLVPCPSVRESLRYPPRWIEPLLHCSLPLSLDYHQ